MKKGTKGDLDIKSMSLSEIDRLVARLLEEKMARAVEDADPDTLVTLAFQEMFTASGDPAPPAVVAPGVIAVAGSVVDTSSGKHTCKLFTIRLPDGGGESWCWEDATSTFIHGDSDKVGKTRHSVNLHVPVDGMILIQHTMAHDGERHNRRGCSAWRVEQDHLDTGEFGETRIVRIPDWKPSHLPPPHGESDQRSYAGRQAR